MSGGRLASTVTGTCSSYKGQHHLRSFIHELRLLVNVLDGFQSRKPTRPNEPKPLPRLDGLDVPRLGAELGPGQFRVDRLFQFHWNCV